MLLQEVQLAVLVQMVNIQMQIVLHVLVVQLAMLALVV